MILFFEHQYLSGNVAEIVFARPEALNAVDDYMSTRLYYALEQWLANDLIKKIIIRSDSAQAFCSGADVKTLLTKNAAQFITRQYAIINMIRNANKPIVVLASGVTAGFGAGIFMAASTRICASNIAFSMPECAIGFFPDVGASKFLHVFGRELAINMIVNSQAIGAFELFAAGLVKVIEYNDFSDWAVPTEMPKLNKIDFPSRLGSEFAISWAKLLFELGQDLSYQELMLYEIALAKEFLLLPDFIEGTNAFLAKRTTNWSKSFKVATYAQLQEILARHNK